MHTLDDLFVIDCLKELQWPYSHRWPEEGLVQDSAGRLFRSVVDTEEVPFARAKEFLAGVLGRHFGLEVPDGVVVRFGHQQVYMQTFHPDWQPFYPTVVEELAQPACVAAILAFDLWLGNVGRASGGLVVRRDETAAATLHLIRHQFSFIGLYDVEDEGGLIEAIPPSVLEVAQQHPLRHAVTNQYEFDTFLSKLERLEPEMLRDFIRRVPPDWLSPGQKGQVFRYLDGRRAELRKLLPHLREVCPSWE